MRVIWPCRTVLPVLFFPFKLRIHVLWLSRICSRAFLCLFCILSCCAFFVASPALLASGRGGGMRVSLLILFVGIDNHSLVVRGRSSLVYLRHVLEFLPS